MCYKDKNKHIKLHLLKSIHIENNLHICIHTCVFAAFSPLLLSPFCLLPHRFRSFRPRRGAWQPSLTCLFSLFYMLTCRYIYIYIHTCNIHMYTYIYIYVCIHIYICTCIYTHVYIYTHACRCN